METNKIDPEDKALSLVFQSLSNPTRRKIVELLRESGRLRVGDIASVFDVSFNAISKHLVNLESAGIISRQINGREHLISINWEILNVPYEWLYFYHHYWESRIDALADFTENLTKED